jgi:FO synthase
MTDKALSRHLLNAPLATLRAESCAVRDRETSEILTYSRKVFIPLTQLCRDVCHYCTFAKSPRRLAAAYLTPDQVLAIARQGAAHGCAEALFTLGDKPELRYAAARDHLQALGFATTVDYLVHVAGLVLRETGLLPHINAGVLIAEDYRRLRPVAASMGLMLESASERLCAPGGPHYGSPDKAPAIRLASIAAAGEARIPFTTGLLIGIGETREERLDSLFAIRALDAQHGHIQEVIIQNFRAKRDTRMAKAAEPDEAELLWTITAARLILRPGISVQAPPNLNPGRCAALIAAGLNDWGGISPVTIDHVNPEAAWPEIAALEADCAAAGFALAERLTAYPAFLKSADLWLDKAVAVKALHLSDSEGLARACAWSPGIEGPAPGSVAAPLGRPAPHCPPSPRVARLIEQAASGRIDEDGIAALFTARGAAAEAVVTAADELRRQVNGDTVTYVVNRNINYTNICTFSCSFCAFSKTSTKAGTRDKPYNLDLEEIAARTVEAWAKGGTEVCLQGGIHPSYTGQTYLDICRAVKRAVPSMHVHAFSPLEISQGAATLGQSVETFLRRLKDEGLGSLPGTAAEILDDYVRAEICPDKVDTAQWLDVIGTAHRIGLKTTATIMFGHLESPIHWARHLLAIRRLQMETGGFTEFVPLPFVHMQTPVFMKGRARKGPTWREAVLMHSIARLVLHGAIGSIQASWVKLGLEGATACLAAGVNDLGGVLMNESISRAAGAVHGQGLTASEMERAALAAGRLPKQRTTLYGDVGPRSMAVGCETSRLTPVS